MAEAADEAEMTDTITPEETEREVAMLLGKLEDVCSDIESFIIGLAIGRLAAKWVHIHAGLHNHEVGTVLDRLLFHIRHDVQNMVRKQ